MFGTDGIRGTVGEFPICGDAFFSFGMTCAQFLKNSNRKVVIAIGRDTRESGQYLSKMFGAGFCANGGHVIDLGIVPTPCVSMYVMANNLDFGASITASHNKFTDNGIKFFKTAGSKLSTCEEREIESLFQNANASHSARICDFTTVDGASFYINSVLALFEGVNLSGKKIVIDSANGATTNTSAAVLRELGADVISIFNDPDGQNINLECGTENISALRDSVMRNNAWLGIAHDGDGDRVVILDGFGKKLDGDELIGILAIALKKENKLSNDVVVTTIQSNSGLVDSLAKFGIVVKKTNIGDRNVFFSMLENNASLGGEESGHVIILPALNTGDGLITAITFAKICLSSTLGDLAKNITLYAKAEKSIVVHEKRPLDELIAMAKVKASLENAGMSILIRYSGTEKKLRFLAEGKTLNACNAAISELVSAAQLDFSTDYSSILQNP